MKRLLSADENGSPSCKRLSLFLKRPATHLQKPPQRFGLLTSEEDFQYAVKGVFLFYGLKLTCTQYAETHQLDTIPWQIIHDTVSSDPGTIA